MAVVSAEVAERLRNGDPARLAIFTASCAERMAQLFSGLRGDDSDRVGNIDTFLEILEALWDLDLPASAFSSKVEALESFVELNRDDDDDVLSEVDDIYSFDSVLCMRYAAVYRASGDPEEAVWCAHVSLTSLGRLDRNIPQPQHFEAEREYQRRTALGVIGSLPEIRDFDRRVSHDRLLVVRSRLSSR